MIPVNPPLPPPLEVANLKYLDQPAFQSELVSENPIEYPTPGIGFLHNGYVMFVYVCLCLFIYF